MHVAICQIHLGMYDCQSLKDKRSIIKSLKDRIRQRYNVSIAEVDDVDKIKSSLLGVAIVGNERRLLEQIFGKIINFIENDGKAEIIDQLLEFG